MSFFFSLFLNHENIQCNYISEISFPSFISKFSIPFIKIFVSFYYYYFPICIRYNCKLFISMSFFSVWCLELAVHITPVNNKFRCFWKSGLNKTNYENGSDFYESIICFALIWMFKRRRKKLTLWRNSVLLKWNHNENWNTRRYVLTSIYWKTKTYKILNL